MGAAANEWDVLVAQKLGADSPPILALTQV